MLNPYTAPQLSFYSGETDILMASLNNVGGLPDGITPPNNGGGNSGVIELPPVPIAKGESYTPPYMDYIEEPMDILMLSDDDSSGEGGLLKPPSSSEIILPPVRV